MELLRVFPTALSVPKVFSPTVIIRDGKECLDSHSLSTNWRSNCSGQSQDQQFLYGYLSDHQIKSGSVQETTSGNLRDQLISSEELLDSNFNSRSSQNQYPDFRGFNYQDQQFSSDNFPKEQEHEANDYGFPRVLDLSTAANERLTVEKETKHCHAAHGEHHCLCGVDQDSHLSSQCVCIGYCNHAADDVTSRLGQNPPDHTSRTWRVCGAIDWITTRGPKRDHRVHCSGEFHDSASFCPSVSSAPALMTGSKQNNGHRPFLLGFSSSCHSIGTRSLSTNTVSHGPDSPPQTLAKQESLTTCPDGPENSSDIERLKTMCSCCSQSCALESTNYNTDRSTLSREIHRKCDALNVAQMSFAKISGTDQEKSAVSPRHVSFISPENHHYNQSNCSHGSNCHRYASTSPHWDSLSSVDQSDTCFEQAPVDAKVEKEHRVQDDTKHTVFRLDTQKEFLNDTKDPDDGREMQHKDTPPLSPDSLPLDVSHNIDHFPEQQAGSIVYQGIWTVTKIREADCNPVLNVFTIDKKIMSHVLPSLPSHASRNVDSCIPHVAGNLGQCQTPMCDCYVGHNEKELYCGHKKKNCDRKPALDNTDEDSCGKEPYDLSTKGKVKDTNPAVFNKVVTLSPFLPQQQQTEVFPDYCTYKTNLISQCGSYDECHDRQWGRDSHEQSVGDVSCLAATPSGGKNSASPSLPNPSNIHCRSSLPPDDTVSRKSATARYTERTWSPPPPFQFSVNTQTEESSRSSPHSEVGRHQRHIGSTVGVNQFPQPILRCQDTLAADTWRRPQVLDYSKIPIFPKCPPDLPSYTVTTFHQHLASLNLVSKTLSEGHLREQSSPGSLSRHVHSASQNSSPGAEPMKQYQNILQTKNAENAFSDTLDTTVTSPAFSPSRMEPRTVVMETGHRCFESSTSVRQPRPDTPEKTHGRNHDTRENEHHVLARKKRRTRLRVFQCHLCSVACSNRAQLKGHLRTHTGERPFKCPDAGCMKAFARNEELTRHRRIHSGERPYACSVCGRAFSRKDHLNKHVHKHDNTAAAAFVTELMDLS